MPLTHDARLLHDLLDRISSGGDTLDHDDVASACATLGGGEAQIPSARWVVLQGTRALPLSAFPQRGGGVTLDMPCPHCAAPGPIPVHVRPQGNVVVHSVCYMPVGPLSPAWAAG